MITVATLATAIHIVSPDMPTSQTRMYAGAIYREAGCTKNGCRLDPRFFVAFYWHESAWNPQAVGDHGKAIGLGQSHSWLYSSACAFDTDPVGNPSPACAAKRDALKSPLEAIKQTGREIRKAKETCQATIPGPIQLHQWLSLMGGRNHPRFPGVWCAKLRTGTHWTMVKWRTDPRFKEIREIVDCRDRLTRSRPCHRESPSASEK